MSSLYQGLSETLQRTCQPLNIRVANKATNTLRSILTKVKTPLDSYQKTGVIYQFPVVAVKYTLARLAKPSMKE